VVQGQPDVFKKYITTIFMSKREPSKKPAEAGGKLKSAYDLVLLFYCLAHTLTLKMKAICSSDMFTFL
jgi:hypothetical protein